MEKMGVACTLDSFSSSDAFAVVGDAPVAELSSQGGCCAGRVRGDCEFMTLSRADFANGYANMYNEYGKKIHSFPCSGLIGYGPKGIVVKRGTLIAVIDSDCRQRIMPQFQFAKEQWQLHDDFMQVRC